MTKNMLTEALILAWQAPGLWSALLRIWFIGGNNKTQPKRDQKQSSLDQVSQALKQGLGVYSLVQTWLCILRMLS